MKRILTVLALLATISMSFCACQFISHNYQDDVLEYAMITDSDDLSKLDEYPNLEYVDLRGSTCYDAILDYIETHPNVTVRFNVTLGNERYDINDSDIVIDCGGIEYEQLLQDLKYLPKLQSVHMEHVSFSKTQLDALLAEYAQINITYTVDLLGNVYDSTVTSLDLSHMSAGDIDAAIHSISLLPQLQQVELITSTGESKLSIEDVKVLSDSCPGVLFNYEFNLFGQRVSTLSEVWSYDSVNIGNEGVAKIRDVLGIMKNCRSVRLDSCGIDDDVLAALRAEFPDKNIAWRVFAGKYSMMTDEEMVRMQNSLTDHDAEVLKYCTSVKYMDLQGSKINNIDFISYMPNLECVVLTQTKVSDLAPLVNCPNLTWLEVSSCTRVSDLSPLSGLRNLKYLNVSNTLVSDLSELNEVPLERFNCVKARVDNKSLNAFVEKHPDCYTVSVGNTLAYGWRYEDERMTRPFPYYAFMQEIFRYNEKGYQGNRKEN